MAGKVRTNWNNFPLFKLVLPYMAGIITAIHGFFTISLLLTITLVAVGILLLIITFRLNRYRLRWIFGFLTIVIIYFLGYGSLAVRLNHLSKSDLQKFEDNQKWIVETLKSPVEKENSIKLEVEVVAKDTIKISPERAILYLEKDSILFKQITSGSRLIVYTKWSKPPLPTNPYQFNYRKYLKRNGISYQAYVTKEYLSIVHGYKRTHIRLFINGFRDRLLENLKAYCFSGSEYSLAAAILLGKDDTMDPRLRSGFSTAGAMHILCVSGLHVGVIFLILDQLLKFLERKKYGSWLKAVLLIAMIWFYAALTGLDPSVLRASTMVSFVIIGKTIRRPTSVYNALAASALFLLIIDPFIISQIGFQLSYLAVLFIVAFQPVLYKLWIPGNKVLDKIWAILTVSIAAQLGTFALAVHYFHIFPVYFLITNLIVIPLSSFIIYAGFLFFISIPLHPLAWLFSEILFGLLWFLKHAVFTIEDLPSASLNFLHLSVFQVLIIYTMLFLSLIWISTYNRKAILGALTLLLLLSLSFVDSASKHHKNNELVLYDAGRGIALDIVSGKSHVVLMDSITYYDPLFAQYNMMEYWIEKGLQEPQKLEISEVDSLKKSWFFYRNNSLVWNNHLFYILTNPKNALYYTPEILVVHHHKAGPDNINNLDHLQKIILTGKVPPWKEKEWRKMAEQQSISIHKLSEGAVTMH